MLHSNKKTTMQTHGRELKLLKTETLRNHHSTLLDIDAEDVITHLYENKVIPSEHCMEKILNEPTKMDRARKLLRQISDSDNPNAVPIFIESMRGKYDFIAEDVSATWEEKMKGQPSRVSGEHGRSENTEASLETELKQSFPANNFLCYSQPVSGEHGRSKNTELSLEMELKQPIENSGCLSHSQCTSAEPGRFENRELSLETELKRSFPINNDNHSQFDSETLAKMSSLYSRDVSVNLSGAEFEECTSNPNVTSFDDVDGESTPHLFSKLLNASCKKTSDNEQSQSRVGMPIQATNQQLPNIMCTHEQATNKQPQNGFGLCDQATNEQTQHGVKMGNQGTSGNPPAGICTLGVNVSQQPLFLTKTVRLEKSMDGYGFNFVNGQVPQRARFRGDNDYFITHISTELAERCDDIKIKDTIISVNGQRIQGLSQKEVGRLIKKGDAVTLELKPVSEHQ